MTVRGDWIDWAERFTGPPGKMYAQRNEGAGIVHHSMEGWYAGSMGELMRTERPASWMFSIKLDGTLVQHYPITASCWASGNAFANTRWWSVELEGTAAMPINDDQLRTALRLIADWTAWSGKEATRAGDLDTRTLWEHREVATLAEPNAGPTSCPSERYARLWAALEDEMPDPRVDALVAALGGMEAIEAWNRNGNSLLLGYAIEQEKQAKLAAEQVRLAEMVAAGDTLAAGDVVDAMKAMIAAWEREKAP
jgi:hypothetical protein